MIHGTEQHPAQVMKRSPRGAARAEQDEQQRKFISHIETKLSVATRATLADIPVELRALVQKVKGRCGLSLESCVAALRRAVAGAARRGRV